MKAIPKFLVLFFVLTLNGQLAFAQYGFGTNSPATSAVVDIKATDKGVLIPRVELQNTSNGTSPIAGPKDHLLVFNTKTQGDVTPGLYYWDDTNKVWVRLFDSSSSVTFWDNKVGNSGVVSPGNYIGTNDQNDVVFKTKAIERMRFKSKGSLAIGIPSPESNAILELNSTTKALLLPRLAPENVATPGSGMLVANNVNHRLSYSVNGSFFSIPIVPNQTVAISYPSIGSGYTDYYNGFIGTSYSVGGASATTATHTAGEPFSANATCANSPVSASGCGGATTLTGTAATYSIKEINGQCWMTENMRDIPQRFNPRPAWIDETDTGNWGYYNTDASPTGWGTAEPVYANGAHVGLLYQWSAAMNGDVGERARGICPKDWHIPSDCEWMYLEHGLGMSVAEQQATMNRGLAGSVVAKLTDGANNASGFSGLYAGAQYLKIWYFVGWGTSTEWWSSTYGSTNATYGKAYYSRKLPSLYREADYGFLSYSVRCLKD